MNDIALALRSIDKRFGGVTALSNASLSVRRGTLHAVLGENGAGKTTLMRIAFGMMHADTGSVAIGGTTVRLASTADAMRRGLGMVHQHFTLVPSMTVAENVALGGRGLLNLRDVTARVQLLCQRTGLLVDPHARVASLGVGAQQRVEILKALDGDAHTLILDEPTAVLTPHEADELFRWLRRYVDDGGTVVLVTHKLQEALAAADAVTVLRHGKCVLSDGTERLDLDQLIRALTGEDASAVPMVLRSRRAAPGACVARLDGATAHDARGVARVQEATLACHAGEILGIAGVDGSGVHELLQLLAGRLAPSQGSASLPATIGFVPEDRQRDALIENFTLTDNLALRGLSQRTGQMPWPMLEAQAAAIMRGHDVRAPSPSARIGSLSGGNQQRFVVGRELDDRPALVVAENPTRGLDIRASTHVLRALAATADAGSAVVMSSPDIDDLLPLADRMLVMFAGRLREVSVIRSDVARAMVGAW